VSTVLDLGRPKNLNDNPVAEKAIEELGLEFLHQSPEGGPVSRESLALATASMNARICCDGVSAREIWTQQDQITGDQLLLNDRQLIVEQYKARLANHPASAKSKAHGVKPATCPNIKVGDLVFLRNDKDKTKDHDKYIVASITHDHCLVQKFTHSQFRSDI